MHDPRLSVISRLSVDFVVLSLCPACIEHLEPHGTDSVGAQRSVIRIVICWRSEKSSRDWKNVPSQVHRESSTGVSNTFDQTHIFKGFFFFF